MRPSPAPPEPAVPVAAMHPPLTPRAALVAGVLGLLSAVLALLGGSFWVLAWWSVEGAGLPVVWLATVVVLVGGGHLAGALLLICGRSGGLLVLTALPMVGVAVVLLLLGAGPSFSVSSVAVLPLGTGLVAGVAAALALTPGARGPRAARRPGALALPEDPWWP